MTTPFIADSKIAAGHSPFRTVWQDTTAAGPILREQMRQLVPERAIDFRSAVFAQARIQRNEFLSKNCSARATSQARIPFHADETSDLFSADSTQKFARIYFKSGIAAIL